MGWGWGWGQGTPIPHLDPVVRRDDLEGGRDLVHLGGASDVEEVGGLPAVGRNDVHGRHRQAWVGVGG